MESGKTRPTSPRISPTAHEALEGGQSLFLLTGNIFVIIFITRLGTQLSFPELIGASTVLGRRIPAIFPALVTGLVIAALTGQFGQVPMPLSLAVPEITLPLFSLPAVLAAYPGLHRPDHARGQSALVRFMQSQDYRPPDLAINAVSGIGTMLGSFFGPTGISLSLPVTSLVAGSEAGEHEIRHRAVYLAAGAALLVGLLAGIAAAVADVIPLVFLGS